MSTLRKPSVLLGLALIFSLFLGACDLIGQEAPLPTLVPTAAVTPGTIGGQVWQDICVVIDGQAGNGCVPTGDGHFRADGVRAPNEPGLGGIMVGLGLSCPANNPVLTTFTSPDGSFTFKDLPPATYCLAVDPTRPENGALRAGGWTAPTIDAGQGLAFVSVTLGSGEQKLNVDFARDPGFGPAAATSTPTAPAGGPTPTSTTAACTDRAAFVADVSVPDNTVFAAGATFVKTWRLQNAGACAWTTGYALVMTGGNLPATQTVVPLAAAVAPGGIVDVSAAFVAPANAGTYRSEWQLRNASGVLFGVGSQGNGVFWTQIVVGATSAPATATRTSTATATRTPTPTASVIANWRGEYFNNRTLTGSPVVVRDDVARDSAGLDFNWGAGSPAASVPADNFAVRWTRALSFGAGTYRFRALADDGVRLWIDDQLAIDDWRDGGAGEVSADVSLAQGTHSLKIEYYEAAGDALFKFWWEAVGTPSFPDWKGEYWPNRQFTGSPALVRNDRAVDFDWGNGAPAVGLPIDEFSVRWSRWVTFDSGVYRFTVNADDGVRLYLDGQLVLDEWHDNDGSRAYLVDRSLTGPHAVLVEYFDHGVRALIKVRWDRLPTPTPTATATVTNTPTATPTPTSTATSTSTGGGPTGSVDGQLWQDMCAATGQDQTSPGPLPQGCVIDDNDHLRANGVLEQGEPGIGQVAVTLAEGACGTVGTDVRVYETVAGLAGRFSFTNLRAGRYCLIVDPASKRNAPILAAGVWTNLAPSSPAGQAALDLSLAAGEARQGVNLGWDFVGQP